MLVQKNLDNGLSFIISDHSRPIAADRWYVKVVGVISLPLTDAVWASIDEADPALLAAVRCHLGAVLEHRLVKDRNFVAADVKQEVVSELVVQLVATIGAYLDIEVFPARLLAHKYQEAREICRLARRQEQSVSGAAEEPADFSHCFR